MSLPPVPVVLFAYARPEETRRTLEGLRANGIPLLYVFLDGPKPETVARVEEVARIVADIDWCEVRFTRRPENRGLGASILSGVSEVFREHASLIVFEDDLVCAPGTYAYLCAALEQYRDDPRVMSVTGRTHPRITPPRLGSRPYFDGRADSWSWGTWRRVWGGMGEDALTLLKRCEAAGLSTTDYGWDLPEMAREELERNLWAVRFCYLHLLHGGLCLRPPVSLVDNIGFGPGATHGSEKDGRLWSVTLPERADFDLAWPEPQVDPRCAALWRRAFPDPGSLRNRCARALPRIDRKIRNFILGGLRKGLGIDLRPKGRI